MSRVETSKKYLTVIGILILSGCFKSPYSNINAQPMINALSGKWSWEKEQCKFAPYVISFTNKGADMHLLATQSPYAPSSPTIETTIYTYNIKSYSNQSLVAEPLSEKPEYTDIGELITWKIKLVDENSFCWRRSDWGENACTTPMFKCGE